jgi:glucan phosphoethanolaminetransferase (alkaline phosphatase superfamily)
MKIVSSSILTLAALANAALSESFTVPFFVWSPRPLPQSNGQQKVMQQTTLSSQLLQQLKGASSCYVLFEQPGVR